MELKIKNVNTTTSSDGSQYGKFAIEPLERGYGATIGNSLRRVLLSRDKKINGPIGLAIDVLGNIYVANYNNNNVLKISKNGNVKVLIGNIDKPYGLYLKGKMLFISSQGTNSVLRYKLHNYQTWKE